MSTASTRLCVLVIGGVDPTCGSGLGRDLLTAHDLGARAVLVGTAWTRQNVNGVQAVEPRAPQEVDSAIRDLLAHVADTAAQAAVKIGMLPDGAAAAAVRAALAPWKGPVVLDPVLRSSSSGSLFAGTRQEMLQVMARASLVTPNLAEAAWLADCPVRNIEQARAAARTLLSQGARAVLVKGGHLPDAPTDILLSHEGEELFEGQRLPGTSPRGTGCALATAIAVGLARGQSLSNAVRLAKDWLANRIKGAVAVGQERHL